MMALSGTGVSPGARRPVLPGRDRISSLPLPAFFFGAGETVLRIGAPANGGRPGETEVQQSRPESPRLFRSRAVSRLRGVSLGKVHFVVVQ